MSLAGRSWAGLQNRRAAAKAERESWRFALPRMHYRTVLVDRFRQ
jgi:hypothetical protein